MGGIGAAPGRFCPDGGADEAVTTAGPERRTARFVAAAPEGASRIALRAKGDGEVTVYGVTLETAGAGLVYDALGANGASVHFLSLLNASSWEQALALRRSDLVILGSLLEQGTLKVGWGIGGGAGHPQGGGAGGGRIACRC